MAGVAFLLKKAGNEVSGCDLHASARTRWLEANGIPVALGHSPSHITADLDVCVFTPAVPKDSPELAAAKAGTAVADAESRKLIESMTKYTRDPAALRAARTRLADVIEGTARR